MTRARYQAAKRSFEWAFVILVFVGVALWLNAGMPLGWRVVVACMNAASACFFLARRVSGVV